MEDVGILNGHLVNITAMWYILWPVGILYSVYICFPILICCTNKHLATLFWIRTQMD
jgi:hypothetical protein